MVIAPRPSRSPAGRGVGSPGCNSGADPSPGTKTFFTYCAFSTKHLVRRKLDKHDRGFMALDQFLVFQPGGALAIAMRMPPRPRRPQSPLEESVRIRHLTCHVKVAQLVRAPRTPKGGSLDFKSRGNGRAPSQKCPSLKAMLDQPVLSAAFERTRRPASVLRSTLCLGAAYDHPSPERIGTIALRVFWR